MSILRSSGDVGSHWCGSASLGPSLLLPALTAVFLGSTQFRGGRFNIWGTVVAVYVLAVGIKGLQLVGAPNWINLLFNGLALLIAVGLSRWERTSKVTGAIRRATTIRRKNPPTPACPPQGTTVGCRRGALQLQSAAGACLVGDRCRPRGRAFITK